MTQQAYVPWRNLIFDLVLVGAAIAIVVVSLFYDIVQSKHDWFQRSGAVMVVFAGYLAYRGLNKYWIKAENSFNRGYWLRTSRNQKIIDSCALVISIVGTVVWGYGDKIFTLFV